ncbi:MAG: nitronate monooxygenase, partial [Candidatus Heimdallarchaeota archaeon]|nr:nitronate monooxygenase [Candidatus Heimdallarchaeota archaeon]MCK4955233.1 nitronate monooxygenase [Candidatus Heimdallarchaeota archaeon]
MKNRVKLMEFLQKKHPIWGYTPKGISDPTLSIELSKLNAVGLVDFEGLTETQSKNIIRKCLTELDSSKLWGVRVINEKQLIWLEEFDFIPIVVIAFEVKESTLSTLTTDCELLVAEVCDFEQAREKSSWADLFIVKGFESGGIIKEKSSFILLQQFNESGFPFLIQGGYGVYNVISAFVGGALGVVMDGQFYLLPECPLSNEVKDYISTLEENDTYIIGESSEYKYRLIGKIANQAIRNAKDIEKNSPVADDGSKLFDIIENIQADST